ncbi:Utp21-domain-containing protein [Aulographum hederae CBS 113979]|uniref:Utp21-domain-containing protein n=1 Tax=Aulographum hederae CBS 113979 TaxID=1176131 RepID=A0A6G1GNF1_9PEZI|nr:Utp21-domain-containing protein [Aulographum hederae CBS 113979]
MPSAVQTATVQVQDAPIIKRQKLAVANAPRAPEHSKRHSRIFAPYRTIGLISPTDVPFTSVPLGKTTFQITTSVGRSLQTYDLKRGLNLVFVTQPQTPEEITATTAWKSRVIAAWGGQESGKEQGIWVFKRGKKEAELEMPPDFDDTVSKLITFGSWIFASSGTKTGVWKASTLEHYTTLVSPTALQRGRFSQLTSLCTMPTHLNKILAGRQDGTVEIWNVSTGKLLHTILPAASDFGAVTALEPTPAFSCVAIAYETGPVVIQDVRCDKEIMRLNTGHSSNAPVSCITFRTDGLGAGEDGQKDGVMATSTKATGDVTFWDLNNGGRKMGILHGAHNPPSMAHGQVAGGISKVEFLPGQAIMVSSGLDNSLKSWIFDEVPFSPIPRILHTRGGHGAPVSTLQFLPTDADGVDAGGKWLLSTSKDRSFWGWSLRRDGQSTELSQGHVTKKAKKMGILGSGSGSSTSGMTLEDLKAPRITCMACSLNRDGGFGAMPGAQKIWVSPTKMKGNSSTALSGPTGWESVVTGHEGDKVARTWFWGRKRAGRWAFETGDGAEVTSVAMSPCGTFALIGSAAGGIDMFNLQSGIHRQRFPARLTATQAKRHKAQAAEKSIETDSEKSKAWTRGEGKHTKAVTGILVDSLNKIVISCGDDGKVKFWEFSSGRLLSEIDWYPMTGIKALRHHRPNDLVALSCDDSSIRVIDMETKKLIRELWGCKGKITDFTFSNDGRWIIAASEDHTIRVWDLSTGHMIDAFKLRSKCTALAFSNTGEHLATAQEDSVGVQIWTNRSLFTHVPTRHISDADIVAIDAPSASGEVGEGLIEAAYDEQAPDDEDEEATLASTIDQLSEDMLTLSVVPKSRWQTLLHLDVIRQRNKPKEPPKAPEKAPFFLPSLRDEGKDKSAAAQTSKSHTDASVSRISQRLDPSKSSSDFTTLLLSSHSTSSLSSSTTATSPILTHLSTLPPSAADLAIRSLSPASPYTELIAFVDVLTLRLKQKRDFELVVAWMAVFLRGFGEVVGEEDVEGVNEGGEDVEGVKEGGEALRASVRRWREEMVRERERVGRLVGFCAGVGGWVRGTG